MVARRAQVELAAAMRERGRPWTEIAAALRDRYGLNCRAALRLAHCWSQAEAAEQWNSRWPDEPKTSKNFSYWENWPAESGYEPSLSVLGRLAELYECDTADLVADAGTHRAADRNQTEQRWVPAVFGWQMHHLDLAELTGSVRDVGDTFPDPERRPLLLKLSAAAAAAAPPARTPRGGRTPSVHELAGPWDSRYQFVSSGRSAEFTGTHRIILRAEGGRLVGVSPPTPTGSVELDLSVDGLLISGAWTERTSATGYYRGAVYHGLLQLVLDPTGRTMTGRWLGPDKSFRIDSGDWQLTRAAPSTSTDPDG